MIIIIDNIIINVEQESKGIRLKTDVDNLFLENQTLKETKEVIEKNYKIVKNHFQLRTGAIVESIDLKQICLKIVFYYLYMYNLWRRMYKREANRDLTFLSKDFDHPQTDDIIIQFFKEKYPNNYADRCEVMLKMSPEDFKAYAKNRQDFQEMF
jgi:hypothetical protein